MRRRARLCRRWSPSGCCIAHPGLDGQAHRRRSQSIVLRAAPVPSAPVMGMLRRGDTVALLGCDAEVLWCQTEDESWLLGYMVDALPGDLPIFDHPGVSVKTAKLALTPTAEPFTPPPSTRNPRRSRWQSCCRRPPQRPVILKPRSTSNRTCATAPAPPTSSWAASPQAAGFR